MLQDIVQPPEQLPFVIIPSPLKSIYSASNSCMFMISWEWRNFKKSSIVHLVSSAWFFFDRCCFVLHTIDYPRKLLQSHAYHYISFFSNGVKTLLFILFLHFIVSSPVVSLCLNLQSIHHADCRLDRKFNFSRSWIKLIKLFFIFCNSVLCF